MSGRSNIGRLLFTAGDDELLELSISYGLWLHFIERRGQTVLATVYIEDLDETVVRFCRDRGITVQWRVEEEPYWRVMVRGKMEPWRPSSAR